MERINFATGSPFEPLRGYSRVVVVGDQLFLSGTTAMTSSGDVTEAGNPYEQTKEVLSKVRRILSEAGFSLTDVVRTRLYVTNIGRWEEYARAHREVFQQIRPASSIVQVSKLVDSRLVLEMEIDAVRGVKTVSSITLGL